MEEVIQHVRAMYSSGGVFSWIAVFIVAVIATLVIKVIFKIISSRLRLITSRTVSVWDDIGVDLLDGLRSGVIFFWVFYFLSDSLIMNDSLRKVLLFGLVLTSIFQFLIWGLYLIKNWRKNVLDKRIEQDPSSAAALGLLYTAVQAIFFIVLFLIGLSNLGVDITALIAGLGVGGIAVALAAQNILGDLLASLSIVLDKPFVVGDFIVAGKDKGTVEQIGIKTTRLRALSGEQLVLSNKDVLESRVQNFKRLWTRRVVQGFGVTYSTPLEQLKQIPEWVKAIILKRPKLKFDRCHFNAYGASSLDFEFVFFVEDPDYNVFMDLQQEVLFEIFEKLQSAGVSFAFPTRTIHVDSMPKSGAEKEMR